MNRTILTLAFVAASCGLLCAQQSQQSSPSDPYQGVSHPPADDTIMATQQDQYTPPQPKPAAGRLLVRATPPATAAPAYHPSSVDPNMNYRTPDMTGTDDGIVRVASPSAYPTPELAGREAADPDGDIVHPYSDGPETLPEGTMIRTHLITELSTARSQRGDEFRCRVASDVLRDDRVLIPAGAEIDGRVVEVSSGTAGGHGTLRLRPDWVVLLDGSRYRLSAQVTDTPGSNTRVSSEGVIAAGSRYKKDGIEYGGGVGAGVVTGAVLGGPVGALAGGLVGAGAITVHLLMDHPQANLEPGTVLIFSLNDRLNLQAASMSSN